MSPVHEYGWYVNSTSISMHNQTHSPAWQYINNFDLVCFSHLRWNFVYQRPQHLLSRFSKHTRVFFIEEPIFHDADDKLYIREASKNLYVIVPHLKEGKSESEIIAKQKKMIGNLFAVMEITKYISWYYTPMALPFTQNLQPRALVYDCMDELSAFKFAPPALKEMERKLMDKADLVFTGGYSIYEAKKNQHPHIYPFPSSIDKEHFAKARTLCNEPEDQAQIPHPRFGFFGVIDERFDIDLIEKAATLRPDWHFVLIGPVVKIDPAMLPKKDNIHYLGVKQYDELPHYLAGWDVAIIPFALNESTRYISPTKTPEYLAAGKPVISTAIRDVVSPYGENKLVHIVKDAEEFVKKGERILKVRNNKNWLAKVDAFLSGNSWDRTWSQMAWLIESKLDETKTPTEKKAEEKIYV